jgi:serine/threonine protein kinase
MSILGNKYKIIKRIGDGSFGTIFEGINIRTNENVAIKIEPVEKNLKLLKNESNIYNYLNNVSGIPTIKWFGKDSDNYYMVINLLGSSLESVKKEKGTFSLHETLQIGIQIIKLLETIHQKGLVHRDIKPDNFLFGLKENEKKIHIIDFGFCKTYLRNSKHIPLKKTSSLIGSQTYASINAHEFYELSRRDDLISLGYVLIYLYMGKLEWQYSDNSTIVLLKKQINSNSLIPNIILYYLILVSELRFDETPDYTKYIFLFNQNIL